MTYVVTENCIRCKLMDCVDVCPVSCFHEGENMLVINQDECIDCAACEPLCPVKAIVHESEPEGQPWLELNRKYGSEWPAIARKGMPPADADAWREIPDKFAKHFSPAPGKGA